jgi:hypothetical protein
MRFALVALVACGAAVPPVPGKGGPAWNEIESEHFTLWTDAGVERGRELIRQMEYLHQVVYGVAFPGLPTDGRTFAIALRDKYEVGAYLPDMFQAYALPLDSPVGEPMLVFAADTDERDGHVVTHELTHVISFVPVRHQPVWFAEGIAQFFETVKLDTHRAVVDVGEPLKNQVIEVRRLTLLPGDQLFACKQSACRDERFYMTSALLFSYLANVHPAELLRYEDHLMASPDTDRAWSEVFPTLPPAALDRELRTWVLQGSHRIWHFTVQLREPAMTVRALGDGDVYAARAALRSTFYPDGQAAEIDRALAADPTNVLARLEQYLTRKSITPADARATAAAHPGDWRAHALVVFALQTGAEADAARAKACALAATNRAAVVAPLVCPSPHALDAVPGAGQDGGQPLVPQ